MLHNASYTYAYFFWILSSIRMKFGQILVCYMTNISNMFLGECRRLETISWLFYDFIKMTIQAFQWIFCTQVINRPCKEVGRLYNFYNFVIIFSLMWVTMICRSSNIFYRFGNDRILPKNVHLKQKSTKTKNYVINYPRYIHYNKK